ncbi:hypothetical protein H696_06265 [Fonticula alba]|uniref:Uncharacterized protein n=1 Tax=Fonticula alba TaxID=691883 RepID=A0A058Z1A3_FONAL|nr:hypothetical protein H696_06265 [Fonticula alba]KCV67312.1 hypothetical protein H696_06265 [Fonticula alba]|eukprot:XP_009498283.1 hypothetical protein H696_06265 [Fonticula alba]
MPLHDLIGQIFLLYGVSIGSSLAIGFRMRRTLILYRERRRHDAEAVECIHSGQVLPVPKHAVCKFCKTHGVFWKPSVTCHRPSHIRVPPVMACIGHLTQEHRALMVMLLAPMS